MKREEMEELLKVAARKYSEGRQAKRPETQFAAGARWLWELLMEAKDVVYYEEVLRRELKDRLGKVEDWQESLIHDLADQMVERDEETEEIRTTGRSWKKYDKNMNPYMESNPHVNLKKETVRSIGIMREHLGLSFKSNPERMKSPKKNGGADSNIAVWMRGRDED